MVTNLDTFGHFFTLCVPKNDFWRIQYFWINLTLTFVSLRPLKPQIYKIERKIRQQFAVYNVSKVKTNRVFCDLSNENKIL